MARTPRTIAVIPARGGSKGIPRKNIRPLGGKPLLAYTVQAALGSRRIDHLVVSTEDGEIAMLAEELGVQVVRRPLDLAADDVPTFPVVEHALHVAETREGHFDIVVTLHPTTPFRTSADIDAAIDLLETSGADAVVGVVRVVGHHPARMKRIVDGRLVDIMPEVEGTRRQDLPPVYLRNGAIYVSTRGLIDRGHLRGDDQCPYEMPAERSINIDEPLDFLLAETILSNQ